MATRRRGNRKPLISVIVVNYNVREFLRNALTSLRRALKKIPGEIIVVDNASTDDSVSTVRREFRGVRIVANTENVGFAQANNQALANAKGEFLLLINPDTIVQEETLAVMVDFFRKHPDAGLAGCKILNPDGSFQLPCRRSFPSPWVAFTKIVGLSSLFPRSRWFGRYNLTYLSTDESYEVDAVSGSFMMLRRSVYEKIGGLDEAFFMYGEDIDWCYRVQQAGWKVYYVHETSIIHYKGESTRRSSVNETRLFYEAMNIFVNKYFSSSTSFRMVLRLGILISGTTASVAAALRSLKFAWLDFLLVDAALLLAEWAWRGRVFIYPSYGAPVVYLLPALIAVASLYSVGAYTHRVFSISRSLVGVGIAFFIISALTAFFKDYAFSRAIVLISGLISAALLPGWRLLLRRSGGGTSSGVFSRKTVVVGTDHQAEEVIKRLSRKIAEGYDVVGCIGRSVKEVGQTVGGVIVVGTLENLPNVIQELHVTDVIVAPGAASYRDLLTAISVSASSNVAFHIVPNSMEVIIGKAAIDTLSDVPLVPISYNIRRPLNRMVKRSFDLAISALLLCTVYPILYAVGKENSRWRTHLPAVFLGAMSLVGPPASDVLKGSLWYGKPGITGLIQLKTNQRLHSDEREQLHVFYARNQSFLLDAEILLKTFLAPR